MTHLSWVALNGMAYSFIELRKPFCHDKRVIHKSILTAKPHQKSFILLVLQEEKQKTKKQTNNILHCVIHRDPLGMPPPPPRHRTTPPHYPVPTLTLYCDFEPALSEKPWLKSREPSTCPVAFPLLLLMGSWSAVSDVKPKWQLDTERNLCCFLWEWHHRVFEAALIVEHFVYIDLSKHSQTIQWCFQTSF